MTYRIVTISGRGLPADVDSDGYDTRLAAEAIAEDCHSGDYRIEGPIPVWCEIGEHVDGGEPRSDDYDHGRVLATSPDGSVEVAWYNSGDRTTQHYSALQPYDEQRLQSHRNWSAAQADR